jgi:hypothetical protein
MLRHDVERAAPVSASFHNYPLKHKLARLQELAAREGFGLIREARSRISGAAECSPSLSS